MLAPVLLDLCKEHTQVQARSSETLPDLKTVPCLFDKEDEFRVITRGLNSEEIFSKFINTTHFVEDWMKGSEENMKSDFFCITLQRVLFKFKL